MMFGQHLQPCGTVAYILRFTDYDILSPYIAYIYYTLHILTYGQDHLAAASMFGFDLLYDTLH